MLLAQGKTEKEIRSVVSPIESNYKSFFYFPVFLMTSEMPLSDNVKCYGIEHSQILRVLSNSIVKIRVDWKPYCED
jgi:hypothetical protein